MIVTQRSHVIAFNVLAASGAPSWVTGLSVNEWTQLSSTSISSVDPDPLPSPIGNGVENKIDAWNTLVLDSRNSKVYQIAGGGHNDYSGNECDVLDLSVETPAWAQLRAPTASPNQSATGYYSDGNPASRHQYYGLTIDEGNERLLLYGGAYWNIAGSSVDNIDSYNLLTNAYNAQSTHPDLTSAINAQQPVFAVTRDPATDDAYLLGGFNLAVLDVSANTITDLSPTGTAPHGYETPSAVDTLRNRVVWIGGQNTSAAYFPIGGSAYTAITLTGATASDISSAQGAGMFYDPTGDRFLMRRGGDSGGTVYAIDASTFAVTTLSTTGGGTIATPVNNIYNRFLHVPLLGGAFLLPNYASNAWFLKLEAV